MPIMTASTIILIPEEITLPEHALGQESRFVPEGERHQDEAGQRGQLEFDDGDEKLDRQHEEGEHGDEPGEEQAPGSSSRFGTKVVKPANSPAID